MEQDKKKIDHSGRRLARLAAVQGLYQIELSTESAADLVRRFREDPAVLIQEEQAIIAVDADLFGLIVSGANEHQADLDGVISGVLDPRLSIDRIEPLLKAILRAGAYELLHNAAIPHGVIVNDYVDVAHGFFDAKEPGLVNALLDRIAKKARS